MSHLLTTHQAYYQLIPLKSQTAHQHNKPSTFLLPLPLSLSLSLSTQTPNTQQTSSKFQVSSFKTRLIPRHMPTDRPPIYPDNPTISPSHHSQPNKPTNSNSNSDKLKSTGKDTHTSKEHTLFQENPHKRKFHAQISIPIPYPIEEDRYKQTWPLNTCK